VVVQQVSGEKIHHPRSGIRKLKAELIEPRNEAGSEVEGFDF